MLEESEENAEPIGDEEIVEEVEAVTSRVLLINDGKNVFDGTPAEFKKKSKKGSLEEVFAKLTGAK